METFRKRVDKETRRIRKKPGSIESWFYNTVPIDEENGTGKYSGDLREKNNASLEDLF